LVGLIVQPIVGHYSDRTWNKLGRRRPYFLAGAILSASALTLMPNANILSSIAPLVIIGAAFLMIMDACFNLAMEPFRALVADNLPDSQRTQGFAIQTFLIGIGAVAGSLLPYILNNWFDVPKDAPEGVVGRKCKTCILYRCGNFYRIYYMDRYKNKRVSSKRIRIISW
jgi:maltose/moltooligosaccharide transporter